MEYFKQRLLGFGYNAIVLFGSCHFLFDEALQISFLFLHLGHLCLHHLHFFALIYHIVHEE